MSLLLSLTSGGSRLPAILAPGMSGTSDLQGYPPSRAYTSTQTCTHTHNSKNKIYKMYF